MSNFFEELKKYFEVTPPNKVLEDWAKSEEFDKISPTFEEFIRNTQIYYRIHSHLPLEGCLLVNNNYSPKFTSGFFMFK